MDWRKGGGMVILCLEDIIFSRNVEIRGGGQLFCGGYVPHRFPKVGSREQISMKNEGSWEGKFRNFTS